VKSARQLSNESDTPLDVVDAAGILGKRRFWLVNHLYIAAKELGFALDEAHELDESIPPSVNVAVVELREWLLRLGLEIDTNDD
jgi:hypothetical protein